MKKTFPAILTLVSVLTVFLLSSVTTSAQEIRRNPQVIPIKKRVIRLMPRINSIEPLYDDCQLIFYVKGIVFGAAKGSREIRMVSGPFSYKPQITAWSANKIDCLLRGNFELGRKYSVFIFDTTTNKKVSNSYSWLVKTVIKLPPKTYSPGENAAISGHLMGFQQAGRRLQIGRMNVAITQWTCEDILFNVPNLRPGTYKMVLKKGNVSLSNVIPIKIGGLPGKKPPLSGIRKK